MASVINEESVEKKLRTVTNTQDSIQTLSLWIIHHKNHHAKIVELWMRVLKKTVQPSHRLTLFYLCNDVVQTCKKKKAYVYNTTFKECLREAASLVRDYSVKDKVARIFNIWGERGVYDDAFIKSLQSILNGQPVKTQKASSLLDDSSVNSSPISPAATPQAVFESKETPAESQYSDSMIERDEEESARILAEFKPHEMIEQITAFKRQEVEIKFKVSQLSHLKLDASSIEAVKQLKDRAHGNDFSNQFEDSCTKLEDLVKRQARFVEDQRLLIETLQLSETFYEEQYREAKIVANAYKNFGARINNMKKKLDELKRSMPEQESPVPSPDMNAPSPGNTPPYVQGSSYGYNPATPANYGQDLLQKAWTYNGTGAASKLSVVNVGAQDSSTFEDSPPVEAPSPEGSPPDLNLEGSDTVSVSLESRLASFFDRNRSEASNPPVYTPQLTRPVISNSKLKLVGDDDGSTTPLDDEEAPTTPVQDENLVSPPKRNTPPKKENPIDFLTKLISQTQKAPVKTGAPSFLDSLTLLSSVTKKPEVSSQQQTSAPQSWAAWKSQTSESSTLPTQPSSTVSFGLSSSLPTSSNLYPLTPTMVPPPIPMPVPPPISAIGMNVPPPPPPPFGLASVISATFPAPSTTFPTPSTSFPAPSPTFSTPSTNFPPPPTKFPPQSPNFSAPPPVFQQTSPGQKENWPEMKPSQASDHATSSRTTHNSVLKEIIPADDLDVKSSSQLSRESSVPSVVKQDSMEAVSDEEDEQPVSKCADVIYDAKAEFAQKLKQKTSQVLLKSHVFVPNPERPNLMTLTVSDDLDEDDTVDEDTVMEEAPHVWPDRSRRSSHKSRSRSRSRSRDKIRSVSREKDRSISREKDRSLSREKVRSISREKDRSHKHKKKKKYKRSHSSDEDTRMSDGEVGESRGLSSVGSVVKKIDSHSSRNSRDSSKGDKYEDRRYDRYDDDRRYDKYDDDRRFDDRKYDDRKPDRYDDRGYDARDYKGSYKNNRGSKDVKDTVQAYTQAYRDAFFQQYSLGRFNLFPPAPPPPPMDPRRPGYGKY